MDAITGVLTVAAKARIETLEQQAKAMADEMATLSDLITGRTKIVMVRVGDLIEQVRPTTKPEKKPGRWPNKKKKPKRKAAKPPPERIPPRQADTTSASSDQPERTASAPKKKIGSIKKVVMAEIAANPGTSADALEMKLAGVIPTASASRKKRVRQIIMAAAKSGEVRLDDNRRVFPVSTVS